MVSCCKLGNRSLPLAMTCHLVVYLYVNWISFISINRVMCKNRCHKCPNVGYTQTYLDIAYMCKKTFLNLWVPDITISTYNDFHDSIARFFFSARVQSQFFFSLSGFAALLCSVFAHQKAHTDWNGAQIRANCRWDLVWRGLSLLLWASLLSSWCSIVVIRKGVVTPSN